LLPAAVVAVALWAAACGPFVGGNAHVDLSLELVNSSHEPAQVIWSGQPVEPLGPCDETRVALTAGAYRITATSYTMTRSWDLQVVRVDAGAPIRRVTIAPDGTITMTTPEAPLPFQPARANACAPY
jgi:hypothetical protein